MTNNYLNTLDKIRGSLIGGAIGDALGYTVEFWDEQQIFDTYGSTGINNYKLVHGKAVISDDTQMTLFTANGLLVCDTTAAVEGIHLLPRDYVKKAYEDWYFTQTNTYEMTSLNRYSWLLDVPELYAQRAPGITCLSAIRLDDHISNDFIHDSINHSKGCGGIMRISPIALRYRFNDNYRGSIEDLDMEAAQIAAITHSHSLGYMPAAVLSHIISRIIQSPKHCDLKQVMIEARDTVKKLFANDLYINDLVYIIDLALRLSENDLSDLENIHQIGEGWVAEETLGISLYCALKYQNDFSSAIIAAVNHKGDSDSTGAVTGNIVGALVGYDEIDEKWKRDLECSDIILEVAEDLCYGATLSGYTYKDPKWINKYMNMHHK